jgi:hypothetical protein
MRLSHSEVRGALYALGVDDPWVHYTDYGHYLHAAIAVDGPVGAPLYFPAKVELKRHGHPSREELRLLADGLIAWRDGRG